MSLEVAGVSKAFGSVRALSGVDLSVPQGSFFALLGPSGCGKTTLLRVIAGIYASDAGKVALGGRDITQVPMHRRNMAMVFQSYALFPHLCAFDNVAFGLRSRRLPKDEIRSRVAEALALVRLEQLSQRYPSEMSGGQQQRIALARALAVRPDLLLLDEPLSNLDQRLRDEMRVEIRDLQRRLAITTVLVTHDISEAFTMSDRIGVMQEGRIVQIGSAEEIYHRPANRFVANFVGPINELPLTQVESGAGGAHALFAGQFPVRLPALTRAATQGSDLTLILRPQALRLGVGEGETANRYGAEVEDVVFLGASSECRLRIGPLRLLAALPASSSAKLAAGDKVIVGWDAADGVVTDGR
jgi:putative spermidine/putrescine transport system ATP-binding protein